MLTVLFVVAILIVSFLAAGAVGPAIVVAVINASIRGTVPIALGAMSGVFSERSGIVNIGIEGMMLIAAYIGFMINVALSSSGVPAALQAEPVRLGLSLLGGVLVGGLMGLLHAVLSIRFKVDHIISGTVINTLALGLTGYFYLSGATTLGRLPPAIKNPFSQDAGFLFWIGEVLFNKGIITYMMFLLVIVFAVALFRTVWGLRTRAIGEHPRAADTLGINVHRLQYKNLFFSGCVAGLGGVFLTLEAVGTFERGMTNGRGFIALAVMIFGNWHPLGAAAGALLFGFATALQGQLQFFNINIPHQFVGMLPYLLTVIVLAGFVGRAKPPAYVGQTYEVE
ncbi:MAG: ABC transporter permease [Anaerolineae bacterium]|nr:ABC transporter permease [Anaerolineae bacterium]